MFWNLLKARVYFDAGDGGGSTGDGTGADGGKTADGQNAGNDNGNNGAQAKVTFTPEQQAEVDRVVADRLARAKKASEGDAEKARKKAEEEALTKNKEFETLANTRQQEIEAKDKELAALKEVKEQSEKYAEAIGKIVKTQIEKLPKPVQVLLAKMSPLEQMDYLAQYAKDLNLDLKDVPETNPNDASKKLTSEAMEKGKADFKRTVKGFLR
jgi:hypothetical protein